MRIVAIFVAATIIACSGARTAPTGPTAPALTMPVSKSPPPCPPIPSNPPTPTYRYTAEFNQNYVEVFYPEDYPRCYGNKKILFELRYTHPVKMGQEPDTWVHCTTLKEWKRYRDLVYVTWPRNTVDAYQIRAYYERWVLAEPSPNQFSAWTATAWTVPRD